MLTAKKRNTKCSGVNSVKLLQMINRKYTIVKYSSFLLKSHFILLSILFPKHFVNVKIDKINKFWLKKNLKCDIKPENLY